MSKVFVHMGTSLDGYIAGPNRGPIGGGREVVLACLNAGLVDELCLAVAPLFLGEGLRLFEGIDRDRVAVEVAPAIHSPQVTHLRYAVRSASCSGRAAGGSPGTSRR